MADLNSSSAAGTATPAEEGHPGLRRNAIGLADAIIVGMASSGPTASLAVTLAAIVAASSFAGPIAILVCFLPMLGIALAYRRLNQWRVDCGASYVWVGRAITPYLGFMVGWIMLLGYFLGTISDILPVGPYVLQVIDPSEQNSSVATAISASVWLVIVTVIAYIGIQLTARFQWLLATVEYVIVTVFAVVTLVAVFGHHRGTSAFHWSWFSWHSMGGTSGLVGGILIAVYMFSGWDTSVYVNEETRQSRVNPGRAVVVGVITLGVMYAFFTFAFEGGVTQKALQANGDNALAYIVKSVAGSPWDKVMTLAVLLSIVGATQTALVAGARIAFAMGQDRVLPSALGASHRRHRTPAVATVVFAVLTLIVTWVYTLSSGSVEDAFTNVVSSVGLMFALFYAATGIAMAVYYRRLAARGVGAFLQLALVPLISAAFLIWVAIKSVPGLGGWNGTVMHYMYVMLAVGVVFLLIARFVGRSSYFAEPIEAYDPAAAGGQGGASG
ncbi:MAG TPA: APC family permease [Streptosporangiaceae bacterium]|jgi:amino acid transporter|nr:APC family permease [Streptosporangiaceae bacterium]